MKEHLIQKLSIVLLKKGYTLKSLTRTCFDLLARKDKAILLLKMLEDANAISTEYASEMLKIASYIGASPIIIAEKAQARLHDNVIYKRCHIYTVNSNTFIAALDHDYPFLKRDHAGLTASIVGDKLRTLREQQNLSYNNIARKIGVSKRMVQRYEQGQANVRVNKAARLYSVFGRSIFKTIDLFQPASRGKNEAKSEFTKKFANLGFEATDTSKAPFDIIAKKERDVILTKIGDKEAELKSISNLIDADKLVIFKKKKPKDIPAITKEQFMEFEKARELIKFVKELK